MKRLGWCVVFAALGLAVAQAQEDFPFDGELMLDAAPMPGSKRIPNMDIAANGSIVAGDVVQPRRGPGRGGRPTPSR